MLLVLFKGKLIISISILYLKYFLNYFFFLSIFEI